MAINIRDYDEFKAFILKLRTDSAQAVQSSQDSAWKSFNNGMIHACDQIFVALLSWEKNEPDPPEWGVELHL